MSRCSRCTSRAVCASPPLCARHFCTRFESGVAGTIERHRLLRAGESVLVAASGGKDSMVTLFLLKKLGYKVSALAVDEGIAGYREGTLASLGAFCTKNKIPLRIVSFDKEYANTLDTILKNNPELHPCTVCGTFRRQLLNKYAHEIADSQHSTRGATGAVHHFAAIATGHNADDEAQSVLLNLTRANLDLFPRGGPVTTSRGKGFIRRVKPLYFCTEKEVMLYAVLNSLAPSFEECPYAKQSLRAQVRDELNAYEAKRPGAKVRVLEHYLKVKAKLPMQKTTTQPCERCGEPSQDGVCKACRIVEDISS